MSSKLFSRGKKSSAAAGGGGFTAEQKDIIEFDHRFDARVVDSSTAVLPMPEVGGGTDRNVAITLKKYEMEISEQKGVREEKIWACSYTDVSALAWDHQHSTFKVTSTAKLPDAAAGGDRYSITIGKTDGPLGLNLVSTGVDGPGMGKSAAVESVSAQIKEASAGVTQIGHLILTVNGEPTTSLTFRETMDKLRAASRPVTLDLRAVNASPHDAADSDEHFVILAVGNSTELEQNISLRIQASRHAYNITTAPPAISYMGIFAGPEKPKPFQRKRASLVMEASDKLPSPQVMRRLSMQTTRNRRTGIRRALALQHIHEGHNHFRVQSSGGEVQYLVVDYEGLQLVRDPNARPLRSMWDAQWLDEDNNELITQWQVQGDVVRVQVVDSRSGEESSHSFNTGASTSESAGPMHLVHTMEFYMNTRLTACGKDCVPGSTHGRDVMKVHTLTGVVDASSTSSAKLADKMSRKAQTEMPIAAEPKKGRRYSIGGTKPPWWNKLVRYQGWIQKHRTDGLTKWQRRFFIMYRTSQGTMLAYYSKVEDTPLHSQAHNERKMVELCMVTAIRPVSSLDGAPDYAFDIVGVDREWTLAPESKEEAQVWLQLLARAVDEDVAITPDDNLQFQVKPVQDPSGQLPKYDYTTMLKVLAQGVQVCIGPEFQMQAFFWCYTDIHRWSVATHNGKPCLLMSVFLSDEFSNTQDFVFRTKSSVQLSTAIEFYIEKFMSVMQLKEAATRGGADPNTWDVKARPVHLKELPDGVHAALGDELDGEEGPVEDASYARGYSDDEDDGPGGGGGGAGAVDLLGGFNDAPPPAPAAPAAAPAATFDPFGAPAGAAPARQGRAAQAAAQASDPFAPAPAPAAPAPAAPSAGGFDPFSAPAPAPAAFDPFSAPADGRATRSEQQQQQQQQQRPVDPFAPPQPQQQQHQQQQQQATDPFSPPPPQQQQQRPVDPFAPTAVASPNPFGSAPQQTMQPTAAFGQQQQAAAPAPYNPFDAPATNAPLPGTAPTTIQQPTGVRQLGPNGQADPFATIGTFGATGRSEGL